MLDRENIGKRLDKLITSPKKYKKNKGTALENFRKKNKSFFGNKNDSPNKSKEESIYQEFPQDNKIPSHKKFTNFKKRLSSLKSFKKTPEFSGEAKHNAYAEKIDANPLPNTPNRPLPNTPNRPLPETPKTSITNNEDVIYQDIEIEGQSIGINDKDLTYANLQHNNQQQATNKEHLYEDVESIYANPDEVLKNENDEQLTYANIDHQKPKENKNDDQQQATNKEHLYEDVESIYDTPDEDPKNENDEQLTYANIDHQKPKENKNDDQQQATNKEHLYEDVESIYDTPDEDPKNENDEQLTYANIDHQKPKENKNDDQLIYSDLQHNDKAKSGQVAKLIDKFQSISPKNTENKAEDKYLIKQDKPARSLTQQFSHNKKQEKEQRKNSQKKPQEPDNSAQNNKPKNR
jgi:hypothetical protein